ncbi:MAG: hypothetical protein HRU29_12375 [Rhizobiales bacterium]|nr:hypothetical protein [Hyphomicrobiales bacterium]NRB15184.1 hypothetical protein [Hyphomicrobiales bacterium]
MKKYLLSASLILSPTIMVQAEPMTVTTTGDISLYGFYDAAGAFGLGFDGSLSVDGSQYLDDGAQLGVKINLAIPNEMSAYLYYASSIGTAKVGSLELSEHGVEVPEFTDPTDIDFAKTSFSDVDKIAFGGLSIPTLTPAFTYATPVIAGLKLGFGSDMGKFDTAFSTAFANDMAQIKLGVNYAATYAASDKGIISAGVTSGFTGFEVGSKFTYNLQSLTLGGDFGGQVNTGPVKIGIQYQVTDFNQLDRGIALAGVKFSQGYISVGAGLKYDNSPALISAKTTANLGAKYTLGAFSMGSWAEYKLDTSTFAINSGMDYKATENITVGAGVSYDHAAAVSGAAGVKLKF